MIEWTSIFASSNRVGLRVWRLNLFPFQILSVSWAHHWEENEKTLWSRRRIVPHLEEKEAETKVPGKRWGRSCLWSTVALDLGSIYTYMCMYIYGQGWAACIYIYIYVYMCIYKVLAQQGTRPPGSLVLSGYATHPRASAICSVLFCLLVLSILWASIDHRRFLWTSSSGTSSP